MSFQNMRSDLATESLEQLEIDNHYQREEYVNNGVRIEKINILKEHHSINQGIGTYIEISFSEYKQQGVIVDVLTKNWKPLIVKID